MARKVITFIIFMMMLYCCIGCGVNYHQKRMLYHEQKAISKGAKTKIDTVFKEIKFNVPGIRFETTLEPVYKPDGTTVFIQRVTDNPNAKAKVQIKWRDKCDSTCVETITVQADCPDQEVKKEIPISTQRTLVSPRNFKWWIWLTVGICVGFIGCFILFLRKPKK